VMLECVKGHWEQALVEAGVIIAKIHMVQVVGLGFVFLGY
jgi:hypothetical protein